MLKLLITVGIFPPEIGGPATYVYSLAHWMRENNFSVTVVTAQRKLKGDIYPFQVERIQKNGILFWHLRAFLKIFRLLKQADAVFINGLFSESFLAALLRRKRIVCRISGDLVWERAVRKGWTTKDFLDFQEEGGNIRVRLLKGLGLLYLNRAAKIIVPSSFLADIVQNWGVKKEKIEVVINPYSPVEEEVFTMPPLSGDNFIVSCGGRLVPWKGVAKVIEAILNIPGIFLLVFGDGPEKRNLERMVIDLEMKERVYFTGSVSRGQLRNIFAQSHCFVLNSRYEGLPHVVLEAMAAGCPVIAANIGGIPEIIRHEENGILIEPDDKKSLTRYILALKTDGSLRQKLIEKGRMKALQNFSPDRTFHRIMEIIQG